jgi:cell division protein FtsZ
MESDKALTRIKVIGVGALGISAVGRISRNYRIPGVDYLVVDMQAADHPSYMYPGVPILEMSPASRDIAYTQETVMKAATASTFTSALRAAVKGADMVVIAAAMGDRTGTVASPVVARIAKESGALVLAFVTSPFCFEDEKWKRAATDCTALLRPEVDQTIAVSRRRLEYLNRCVRVCFGPPFPHESWIISRGILGLIHLLNLPGISNLGLADVVKVMRMPGEGIMSIGEGLGCHPALVAADEAVSESDLPWGKARGLLVHFCGGPDLTLAEVQEAAALIATAADPRCILRFGVAFPHEDLRGRAVVVVIATGLQPKGASWQ